MRASQYFITTLKETPSDAEVISHQLMLRAGMIRKLASGLYTWLPLGLRVLRKVETIVREEMNTAGALEVLMPAVQPAELWEESGRWQHYGPELLRFKDRHERPFCFGPTHEEVITDLVRNEIKSYKQLPINLYQIQTKFRDEIRPRFGIMRAREFLMKDAYSFHTDQACLEKTYQSMYDTYMRIFTRLGLNFRAVLADTGSIGGNQSHEFHVLADSGEDAIAFSDSSDYAANVELAEAIAVPTTSNSVIQALALTDTPHQRSIAEICELLKIPATQAIKTLIVYGKETDNKKSLVALVLRGDHELNRIKVEKLDLVASPLMLAKAEDIQSVLGCEPGFIGPIGLTIPIIIDRSAAALSNFVCGANQTGKHYQGGNWARDYPLSQANITIADIRNVIPGDPSPDGKGHLVIKRGIEVGHVFQLGVKYSAAMQAQVLNDLGKPITMTMGCYGIGVSRIVAAAIEQNHDEKGIIWPQAIAPFQVVLLPMNVHKSAQVQSVTEQLYKELQNTGIDVLLDDRDERPGVKFAELELMGIPHRLVISERSLANNTLEYKGRSDNEAKSVPTEQAVEFIKSRLCHSPT